MAEWRGHMLHAASQFVHNHGGGGGASASIAQEVVDAAKNIITGAGDGSESGTGTSTTGSTQQSFSIKHILEALIEPIVITTILVINALVGGYQSLNASKGISALKQMQAQKAVIRINAGGGSTGSDGANPATNVEEVEVDASSLVPGDVVLLTVGPKIPADVRLVSVATSTVTVDEVCLTGESDSVTKMPYRGEEKDLALIDDIEVSTGSGSAMGAHATGMLYGVTVITAGKGVGVVVRTRMDTEMGRYDVVGYAP